MGKYIDASLWAIVLLFLLVLVVAFIAVDTGRRANEKMANTTLATTQNTFDATAELRR